MIAAVRHVDVKHHASASQFGDDDPDNSAYLTETVFPDEVPTLSKGKYEQLFLG